MSKTYRQHFAPIINETLRLNVDGTTREKRRAWKERIGVSRDRYSYRIWLDEIRCQLGLRPRRRRRKSEKECPGQLKFEFASV